MCTEKQMGTCFVTLLGRIVITSPGATASKKTDADMADDTWKFQFIIAANGQKREAVTQFVNGEDLIIYTRVKGEWQSPITDKQQQIRYEKMFAGLWDAAKAGMFDNEWIIQHKGLREGFVYHQ